MPPRITSLAYQLSAVGFRWGWLSIFVAFAIVVIVLAAIIVGVVWMTGGFSGRDK